MADRACPWCGGELETDDHHVVCTEKNCNYMVQGAR